MDFDPGLITAGLTRVQPKSPQELFGEQLRMRAMQQAIESNDAYEQQRREQTAKLQRAAQDQQIQDQALGQSYRQIDGVWEANPDVYVPILQKNAPHLIQPLLTQQMENRKKGADALKAQRDADEALTKAETAKNEILTSNLAGVAKNGYNPGHLDMVLGELEKTFPSLAPKLGQIRQQAQEDIKGAVDGVLATSKTQRELADKDAAQNKPQVVGPGGTLIGRNGEVIYAAPEKTTPVTDAQLRERYQKILTDRALKNPVSPADDAWAKAYEKDKTLVGTNNFNLNAPTRGDARTDRSYASSERQLNDLRKPVADQVERISRLTSSLNQMTPAADALVAPELLTAMAGGSGSGLRMNEAEISRLIGGRSKWEDLKAKLNAWQTDPSKALSITPDQRKQMRDLVREVSKKATAKLSTLDTAYQDLIDATDPTGHRRILAEARKSLSDIATSESAPAPAEPSTLTPGLRGLANR